MKSILSEYESVFKETSNTEIPALLDFNSNIIPDFLKSFQYPISAWPLILNQEQQKQLHQLTSVIPLALNDIVTVYFNNNVERIANFYFQGDKEKALFAMRCIEKQKTIPSRLDLIYSNSGFKILEVNMGSSLGGMEFENFEPIIRSMHTALNTSNNQFNYTKTQTIYLDHLIDNVTDISDDSLLNIIILGREKSGNLEMKQYSQIIQMLLQQRQQQRKIDKSINLHVAFKDDLLYRKGKLFYNSTIVHGVISLDFSIDTFSKDVYQAFFEDKIYFVDYLGTVLLRDKRNLNLLYDLAKQGKFSDSFNNLLPQYIAYTFLMNSKNKKEYSVNEIVNNRKKYVLKIADGLQGNQVYVGKFQNAIEWEQLINRVKNNSKFLVQEFVESCTYNAPDRTNNWIPHDIVWGAFSIGNIYAGTWGRMISENSTSNGVINSATGAIEIIAYEESV